MPIVLVHGNPETDAVWDYLVPQLVERGYDTPIRLSPPGFGAPVPEGFTATPSEYVGWLIGELEAIGEPVDLVGHDVGGGHTVAVAMTRPDLLRSWAADTLGVLDPEYEWHALAKLWQTPGAGEEWIDNQLLLSPADRAGFLIQLGMDPAIATKVGARFDRAMGDCILRLYRARGSAELSRAARQLPAARARPGLAIIATEDTLVGTNEQRNRAAAVASADLAVLNGHGHWWMTQHEGRAGAHALHDFWAKLD